jgi:hypothetical protein
MGTTQEEIKQIRATWANLANHALEHAGYREKIDHRSYADQGNGYKPPSMKAARSLNYAERHRY